MATNERGSGMQEWNTSEMQSVLMLYWQK